jgi:CBS domain-containing protein
MVTKLITVDYCENVRNAVERMNRYEVGCLIVMNEERVVGILTERDVLKRIIVEARNPETTVINDIMSKHLWVIEPEASLEAAIEVMFENGIKKLPVIKDNKLLGLVTLTDIARFQSVTEYLKKVRGKYTLPKRIEKVIRHYVV